MFTFEGTTGKSSLKVTLRIHSPQFYWKVINTILSLTLSIGFKKLYTTYNRSKNEYKYFSYDLPVMFHFYIPSQVAAEADLGLADAYINGDFSFVDKNEGLLNLFMVRKGIQDFCILYHLETQILQLNSNSADIHCQQRFSYLHIKSQQQKVKTKETSRIVYIYSFQVRSFQDLLKICILLHLQRMVDAFTFHFSNIICKVFLSACFQTEYTNSGTT